MDSNNILTVVMPVYNEEATIEIIVKEVLARPEVGGRREDRRLRRVQGPGGSHHADRRERRTAGRRHP